MYFIIFQWFMRVYYHRYSAESSAASFGKIFVLIVRLVIRPVVWVVLPLERLAREIVHRSWDDLHNIPSEC